MKKTIKPKSPLENEYEEIKEIQKAFKNIEKVRKGKLKTRPVEDLLKEL